jgi:hypothetical protein
MVFSIIYILAGDEIIQSLEYFAFILEGKKGQNI